MTRQHLDTDDSKMKTALLFIEDGSFTYDNRVLREAGALVDDGWSVTVISPKYPDDPFKKTISPNLRAYFFPKPNAETAFGHILEHSISLLFGGALTFWVFLRHGFQVFHACNPMDILWLIALPYRLFAHRSVIFDQHDLCPELYLSRSDTSSEDFFFKALAILERNAYRHSDVVIAPNESYKKIAINRGGKIADDIFVVRNGPDLTKFKPGEPAKGLKQDGEILVGYLGNMNPQDGVDILLDAAEEITNKRALTNIRFVFIGGGSSQQDLAKDAIERGMGKYVLFTGRIPDKEMLATLNACDICVQPDPSNPLNELSTMNKAMEYMALEKPVVAFDLKETKVSCGDAARYANSSDIADLANQIVELAGDVDLREQMARAGRERIEQGLAWEHSVPNLLAAYDRALHFRRSKSVSS